MKIAFDQWQEEVLEAKGNILLCSGRQTGKSTIISVRDGDYAAKNPGKSVLILSATERQAEELFIKVLIFLTDNYPRLIKKGKDRPTKHIVRLTNGSVIRCLPTGLAGTGIRGLTVDRLTVDEAAWVPDDVFHAITPMLLTTGGDICLISTPHGRQGYFYDCYCNTEQFKVFHVNSEAVMQNRPISTTWTEHQKKYAQEFLDAEKKRMPKLMYAQEYLGQFVDELRQYFSDELIQKCMRRKRTTGLPPGINYFLGVDLARMGDDESVFAVLNQSKAGKLYHVENKITKKTYTTDSERMILEMDKQYNFKEIYIDAGSGSLGVGIFDHLVEHDQVKRKVVAINNRQTIMDYKEGHKKTILKEQLYANLKGLMERQDIELLDDDEIFQSFKSVQYEYDTEAKALTKVKIFGTYTHIVEALIRAAWASKDKRLNIWIR